MHTLAFGGTKIGSWRRGFREIILMIRRLSCYDLFRLSPMCTRTSNPMYRSPRTSSEDLPLVKWKVFVRYGNTRDFKNFCLISTPDEQWWMAIANKACIELQVVYSHNVLHSFGFIVSFATLQTNWAHDEVLVVDWLKVHDDYRSSFEGFRAYSRCFPLSNKSNITDDAWFLKHAADVSYRFVCAFINSFVFATLQTNWAHDEVLVLPEHLHGELHVRVLWLGQVGTRNRLDGAQRSQLPACVQRYVCLYW